MDLRKNIEERICHYRAKLELVDRSITEGKNEFFEQRQRNETFEQRQMNKIFEQRHNILTRFLYYEKKVYSLAFLELEELIKDSDKQGRENALSGAGLEPIIDGNNPMLNSDKKKRMKKRIYRIVISGGIGDALLSTPVIRTLKQRYPNNRIYVYYPSKLHKAVLMNNKYIDRLIFISTLTRIIYVILNRLNLVKVQWTNYSRLSPSLLCRKHAAEIIGEMLGEKIDDPRPDCFLTEEEKREARKIMACYANPIALHVTAGSSPNKNWPTENWEALVLNNPQYNFLQIGSKNDELIRGVIDLRGASLRQSLGIIQEAKAFVGVDSVMAHAAAAFQTPAVVLFGASTPAVWGHPTSKNLYNPPSCSPCIEHALSSLTPQSPII